MTSIPLKTNPDNKKLMKTKSLLRGALGAVTAVLLATTGCSTNDGAETVTTLETPEGAVIVDTFTRTATVTAVDHAKRKVTLVSPGGDKTTYHAGPEVVNFPQIQVGDQVKATVTEEVAVFIGSGAPPSAVAGAGVALAPVGAKPGGVVVSSVQVTAKVTAVDAKKRKVTFALPEGATKQVKVGKQVNLAAIKVGDNVTVQVSEGLAISVQKP